MTSIVFAKHRNPLMFLSKVIQIIEKLPFSHCAIVCDGFVYESKWPKSRKIELELWLKEYEIVKSIDADVKKEALEEWFLIVKNTPYSISQLFIIAFTYLSAPLKLAVEKMRFNGSKAFICTEMVGMFLEDFYFYKFKESPDTISLRDVLKACSEVLK
jgi:hypothetical protein